MALVVNSDASAIKRTANLPASTSFTMWTWFMLTTDRNTYSGVLGISDGGQFQQLCTETDGLNLYLFRGNPATSTLLRACSLNTWYFAALTCSGTGAGSLIAYIRELSERTWTSVSDAGLTFTPTSAEWGRDCFSPEYLSGRIHAHGMADVVYSADQLMQISQYHEPQFLGLPSLNCFFPTIESVNTNALIDRSGNARNGTATVGAIADAPPLLWKPHRRQVLPFSGSTNTNLVSNGATHAHAVDNLTLTQANTLSVAAASHAHTAANLTLSTNVSLALADAAHAHTAGSPALSQANTLAVAAAAHAHTVGSPTLTQANTLSANGASHGHSAANVALTQANTLSANGATHAHAADSPSLTQAGSIVVAGATHAHTAENVALTQANALAVANALHAHAADQLTLGSGTILSIANAVHSHLAGSPSLTQANTLAISNASHGHAADNLTISNVVFLTVAGSTHSHSAESPSLSTAYVLSISDARHVTLADIVSLTEAGTLVVNDALHAHLSSSVSILLPALGLTGVVFVVSYDRQTFTIAPSTTKSFVVPK